MIESIYRNGTKVILEIDTGLDLKGRILIFEWETTDERFASLLEDQLLEQFDKFKQKIAKQPHLYLKPKELSALKSKLIREWNGSKHCWKRHE